MYLFAQLVDGRLQLKAQPCGVDIGGFGTYGVGFPVEFLGQKVQPPANRLAAVEQAESRLDMSIDPVTRLVTVDGEEIMLTAKEFDLLWMLASHPRQVFNRDQLLDRVWGETEYLDPSTVTVHVRRLREKIETNPSDPRHIHTVWGVGYKFEA